MISNKKLNKVNNYILFKSYLFAFILLFTNNHLLSETIQYSGLSYTTSDRDIQDMFPNTLILEGSLRKTIYSHLKANKPDNSNLKLGVSSSFRDGTYSSIIAIENENVSTISLNNNCLRTFTLGIQVITFSTKDQQILSIKPNAIRRIYYDSPINNSCDILDRKIELLRFAELFYGLDITNTDYPKFLKLSNEQIIETIEKQALELGAYFKSDAILGKVLKDILNIRLEEIKNTNFFVGIDNVELGEVALDQMSGNKDFPINHNFKDFFGEFQKESYKVWAGQQFSKWFSETFNYPLIPYIKGRALGKDIVMKFADSGEALNLRLPSLDFGFVINVKGFKKVKLDESNLREAYAWAAFSRIEFHNVGIEKITEINLKHVYTEEINKSDSVDDWSNFDLSQNRIMKDYISNIDVLNKPWLKKSSKMDVKKFRNHAKVIKDKVGV